MKRTFLIVMLAAMALFAQPKKQAFLAVADGDSTTGTYSLGNYNIAAIGVPSDWTTSNLYVLASDSTSGEYSFVKTTSGDTLIVTATAGMISTITPSAFYQFNHVKLACRTSTGGWIKQSGMKILELYLTNLLKP